MIILIVMIVRQLLFFFLKCEDGFLQGGGMGSAIPFALFPNCDQFEGREEIEMKTTPCTAMILRYSGYE